jgi:hypothetical protein
MSTPAGHDRDRLRQHRHLPAGVDSQNLYVGDGAGWNRSWTANAATAVSRTARGAPWRSPCHGRPPHPLRPSRGMGNHANDLNRARCGGASTTPGRCLDFGSTVGQSIATMSVLDQAGTVVDADQARRQR